MRLFRTKEQWIDGVQGKRSPMWAFMQRMTIPCPNGEIYLARIRLIQTPWFGILLHDIYEPDMDRDPHDHPWTFWSLVLRGGYKEMLWSYPNHLDSWKYRVHSRFSIHRMDTDKAHMITELFGPTRTLIFHGPRVRKWGFWSRIPGTGETRWIHWKDYIEHRDGVRP